MKQPRATTGLFFFSDGLIGTVLTCGLGGVALEHSPHSAKVRHMFKQLAACTVLTAWALPVQAQETPTLLSAFFGLDDSRQILLRTALPCQGLSGGDGMPVIFSHEVDPETLDPEDFRVLRAPGDVGTVGCVTLRPADDLGEFRTALVIGQFGSEEDAPMRVDITGDVLSLDRTLNFRGATAEVIPLAAGPSMIFAEEIAPNYWSLGAEGDCPREGLKTMVRAVWVGGITKPGGDEIDSEEMALYRVSLERPDGTVTEVTPYAVGDLHDNDNNHELCLDVAGTPLEVFFPAGALTDPNEDLNGDTRIAVTGRQAD